MSCKMLRTSNFVLLALILIALPFVTWAAPAYVKAASLWQIEVAPLDGSQPPQPLYNTSFQLQIKKNSLPADNTILKVWEASTNTQIPSTFLTFNETFTSPVDPATLDQCYGTCKPGYSYFFLTTADTGLYNIYIKVDPSLTLVSSIQFYLPQIKYYDGQGNEITSLSNLTLLTGESLVLTAKALYPNGTVDTTFTQSLYPAVSEFSFYEKLDEQGNPINKIDKILVTKGVATFVIGADQPVSAADFDLSYTLGSGSVKATGVAPFPGHVSFSYGDAPSLDSAAIFDTDGDGLGDSIAGWFDQAFESIAPTDPLMSWPVDSNMVPVSSQGATISFAPGARSIGVSVDEKAVPKGTIGAGDFGVTVTSKSGKLLPTTTALKDRIGPVLQAATILPGWGGAPDTLVARFNKELDSSFTCGPAFILEGINLNVCGTPVAQRTWRFVLDAAGSLALDVGDSITIAYGGGIKADDGNLPSPNNRPCIVHKAGSLPPLSADGNRFFDANRDGRMDSIVVEFTQPLSADQLDSIDFRFVWKDSLGNQLELHPDPKDLVWSAKDPTHVYWSFNADSLGVMYGLTSITSSSYGYGNVLSHWDVNGETVYDTLAIPMQESIAPVLISAIIWPVSSSAKKGDSLELRFSEPIDTKAILNADFLQFLTTGSEGNSFGTSDLMWSDSGRVLGLRLAKGESLSTRPNPGDSVFLKALLGGISDTLGNAMQMDGLPIMLTGDARVLVETAFHAQIKSRASIFEEAPRNDNGDLLPISVTFWNDNATLADVPSGSLGLLLNVGQSTLGSLDSLSSTLDLDLSKIGLKWQLDVFTNLGGFVASSQGHIFCNDTTPAGFNGNCFQNRKQMYISWNLLADNGRRVGYGVYAAKLTVRVYGQKNYEFEKVYLWGVSPKSGR